VGENGSVKVFEGFGEEGVDAFDFEVVGADFAFEGNEVGGNAYGAACSLGSNPFEAKYNPWV
jgi:hypothetical protein